MTEYTAEKPMPTIAGRVHLKNNFKIGADP
jgi:hypothetical protein